MFPVRKFYDDGNNGGGGFDITTLPADLQEKLGKYDELVQFKEQSLARTPDKTADELAQEAELDNVNFRKHAVENKLMKNEDFTVYESLKGKADSDLVFEDFSKQFKEDHPEIADDEIEAQTKTAFENQFHVNSADKTLKARGEKLLKKEAAELRTPVETSYNKAKESYDDNKTIKAKHPEYVKFFNDISKETLPDKITLYTAKEGEEEIPVEVEITAEDKKAVEDKFFKNVKTFNKFISGEPEEVKVELSAKINSFIRERKMQEAFSKTWEKAHGIGVSKGSETGAGQPFAVIKGNKHAEIVVDENAKKQAIDSTRKKAG